MNYREQRAGFGRGKLLLLRLDANLQSKVARVLNGLLRSPYECQKESEIALKLLRD